MCHQIRCDSLGRKFWELKPGLSHMPARKLPQAKKVWALLPSFEGASKYNKPVAVWWLCLSSADMSYCLVVTWPRLYSYVRFLVTGSIRPALEPYVFCMLKYESMHPPISLPHWLLHLHQTMTLKMWEFFLHYSEREIVKKKHMHERDPKTNAASSFYLGLSWIKPLLVFTISVLKYKSI